MRTISLIVLLAIILVIILVVDHLASNNFITLGEQFNILLSTIIIQLLLVKEVNNYFK